MYPFESADELLASSRRLVAISRISSVQSTDSVAATQRILASSVQTIAKSDRAIDRLAKAGWIFMSAYPPDGD
jgi:hypothetical protein